MTLPAPKANYIVYAIEEPNQRTCGTRERSYGWLNGVHFNSDASAGIKVT